MAAIRLSNQKKMDTHTHICQNCHAGWNPHWLACQRCGSTRFVLKEDPKSSPVESDLCGIKHW